MFRVAYVIRVNPCYYEHLRSRSILACLGQLLEVERS